MEPVVILGVEGGLIAVRAVDHGGRTLVVLTGATPEDRRTKPTSTILLPDTAARLCEAITLAAQLGPLDPRRRKLEDVACINTAPGEQVRVARAQGGILVWVYETRKGHIGIHGAVLDARALEALARALTEIGSKSPPLATPAGTAVEVQQRTTASVAHPPTAAVETHLIGASGPPRELLEHQLEAVRELRNIQPGKGGILCLPTGSGKTDTAVHWAVAEFVRVGKRVLWLAAREELLDQAADKFRIYAGLARRDFIVRIVKAGAPHDYDGDVLIASLPTLARDGRAAALAMRARPACVIFDEAHHAPAPTYRQVVAATGALSGTSDVTLLGLTATPTRTAEGDRPVLAQMFPAGIIHQCSYVELMRKGILARPRPVVVAASGQDPVIEITDEHAKHVRQWHELPPAVLERLSCDHVRSARVADVIVSRLSELTPMLVFAIGRADAKAIQKLLVAKNVKAEYVDGDTPKKVRESLVQRLRNGELHALVNVQVLTEGTDVPSLRGVVIARPTMSETLYRQMVGRGSRGPKMHGGKAEFTILDFVDNFSRFSDLLAFRHTLMAEFADSEVKVERADRHRDPAAVLSVPREAIEAYRLALSEARLAAAEWTEVTHAVLGWYRWRPRGLPGETYLVVFATDAEALELALADARGRPQARPLELYNKHLFGSLIGLGKFESMVNAIRAGVAIMFERSTVPAPDIGAIVALLQIPPHAPQSDEAVRVLRGWYEAHPEAEFTYPSFDFFNTAVVTYCARREAAVLDQTEAQEASVAVGREDAVGAEPAAEVQGTQEAVEVALGPPTNPATSHTVVDRRVISGATEAHGALAVAIHQPEAGLPTVALEALAGMTVACTNLTTEQQGLVVAGLDAAMQRDPLAPGQARENLFRVPTSEGDGVWIALEAGGIGVWVANTRDGRAVYGGALLDRAGVELLGRAIVDAQRRLVAGSGRPESHEPDGAAVSASQDVEGHGTPASEAPPTASASAVAERGVASTVTFDEAQSAVLDAALAIAGADGEVCAAEFDCVLETLRCMFGRVSTSGVERAVRSWKAPTFINFVAVEKHLDVWQRQLLFQQLAGIAAADQMIAPEEHRMLVLFANHFGMPTAMADLVLGAQLARFDRRHAGSVHCPACGEATTGQARFCSACGAPLGR